MRVDVGDVGAGQAGVAERQVHRADAAPALRVRLHDVVAVGGDAGAGQPGVDPGAAGGGVVGPFEDDGAGALAEHEPVAALVPRAGRLLRLVVAGRHGPHGGETGDRQRVDDRFGAAGHDHVGPAGADDVQAQRHRLGAGGAGAGHRVDAGLGARARGRPRRRGRWA